MCEDAQDPVEVHVLYAVVKKRVRFFINPTDKLDELKAKLDGYFIHICANQRTSDVIVNVSGVDLGEDKEEDFWKTVYFPQLPEDDSDVAYMFSVMVENNTLHFMSDLFKCNIY
jgi:hypothetical protein